jgi:hypothetical protein
MPRGKTSVPLTPTPLQGKVESRNVAGVSSFAYYHVCYVPSRLKAVGRTTVRIAQQNLLVFR